MRGGRLAVVEFDGKVLLFLVCHEPIPVVLVVVVVMGWRRAARAKGARFGPQGGGRGGSLNADEGSRGEDGWSAELPQLAVCVATVV